MKFCKLFWNVSGTKATDLNILAEVDMTQNNLLKKQFFLKICISNFLKTFTNNMLKYLISSRF